MRLFRPGIPAAWFYPDAIFRIRTKKKILCLTFDDGPDPDTTPHLLDILIKYDIQAVFFCRGSAAEKYPELINRIRNRGHLVGNHGYNHLNGWTTSLKDYVADITNASNFTSQSLFRPPYGLLRADQYFKLKRQYKIIFWDIMPYDFDPGFGTDNSLRILKKKIRPGSIIVFHDSGESSSLQFIEEFILFATGQGYSFETSLTGGRPTA